MNVEMSIELEADDLKKDKKLAAYVMKMLAKQSKEKPKKMMKEMPDEDYEETED